MLARHHISVTVTRQTVSQRVSCVERGWTGLQDNRKSISVLSTKWTRCLILCPQQLSAPSHCFARASVQFTFHSEPRGTCKTNMGLLDSTRGVLAWERTCNQKLYGLDQARAIPRLVFKELKLAEVVGNVTALTVSWSDDRRLTSLTNAIKKQLLCKVGISEVLTIFGKNRTNWVLELEFMLIDSGTVWDLS